MIYRNTHEPRAFCCCRRGTADREEEISHACFVLCHGDLEQVDDPWGFPNPLVSQKKAQKDGLLDVFLVVWNADS